MGVQLWISSWSLMNVGGGGGVAYGDPWFYFSLLMAEALD
jgi:hypothetical protein